MMTPPAVAPATRTATYEHLRAWAGGEASPGPRPAGLALVLRRGLAGWMAATTVWRPTQARPVAPADAPAAAPAGEVTRVLATMVAAWQQEVSQ